MAESQIAAPKQNVNEQIAIWRIQANSIPVLLGGKSVWVPLVLNLVELIGDTTIRDLESVPAIPATIFQVEPASGGAEASSKPATWRQYLPFLRGVGLVENRASGMVLTVIGHELFADLRPEVLGRILANKIRLFAETLSIVASGEITVEGVHEKVQKDYRPSWKNLGNTRARLDWQEKLGLISPTANRCLAITEAGIELLEDRILITPEAFKTRENTTVELALAPPEISMLLEELQQSVREHQSRSTYNIWAPSPSTSPNKVENLRTIINATLTKIERADLFDFICSTFELKRSSVESMMPFMRAAGLLVEVGRGVYEATPAAKAWIESGDDINFIRILHAHMRFVGEMIRAVEPDIKRTQMYAVGKAYGINVDKCRWIANFLLSTELIEEPRYGSLRATPTGLALARELPLTEVPQDDPPSVETVVSQASIDPRTAEESLKVRLVRLAEDPYSNGTKPGSEFENAVRDAFLEMGFHARVISGSGDTDVLVQWQEDNGELASAVVEAKARSNGHVAHTDISDVALETHKTRNNAGFIAVVGPSFSGETIRNMADQRGWSLIEAERLGMIVETVSTLGIRPCEAAMLFRATKGLADLDDLVAEKSREMDIVSFVFSKLREEAEEEGEAISSRDISRDGRRSELAPSLAEVLASIELIASLPVDALRRIDESEKPEYVTYAAGEVNASVRRLRALADAIERGTAKN